MNIIQEAKEKGFNSLSEYQSKVILKAYGIPFVEEILAQNWEEIKKASTKIGFPVVIKACSPQITHKTEKKLLEVGIKNLEELKSAYERISNTISAEQIEGYLVQKMVNGKRELMIGLIRDKTFGPCVMLGLGGIFTEIFKDVVFRVAPIERKDAYEMMNELKSKKILDSFRGESPANRESLAEILINVGKTGLEIEDIKEIDINPMIIKEDGEIIGVDALIILNNH